jgi:arylsulfatase A
MEVGPRDRLCLKFFSIVSFRSAKRSTKRQFGGEPWHFVRQTLHARCEVVEILATMRDTQPHAAVDRCRHSLRNAAGRTHPIHPRLPPLNGRLPMMTNLDCKLADTPSGQHIVRRSNLCFPITKQVRFILVGMVAVCVAVQAAFSQQEAARPSVVSARPNVVLILADDLGWSDVGVNGSTLYQTPHIDSLAAAGANFTDAYAACPVCSPTRAAVMTGKYPARLHLTDWLSGRPDRPDQMLLRPDFRQALPLEEVTLAERLRSAGYVTCHIGKWHLGGEGFGPEQQGFDINIAGDHTGTPRSYFAPYRGGRDGAFMPGLEEAPDGEYLTDRLSAEADSFIEQHQDRPFFLYLPHYAVHTPMRGKPELVEKYERLLAENPPAVGQQNNPIYAAMVESLDASVGRVLAKLEELNIDDRTIVIFTSDNGGLSVIEGPNTPATINSPLREGKGYLYEGGIRVPLVIRWPPQISAGLKISTPVSSIDFPPSILELCGVPLSLPEISAEGTESATGDAGWDGVSLAPLLRGEPNWGRDELFWHYPHYSNQGGRPGSAIRRGRYKLIEFFEQGRRELYDLARDPRENRNLINERPDVANELAERLAEWRKTTGVQMMRPNPNYVAHPPDGNGVIKLPARTAIIEGTQLRYEALPHKETLGFWTRLEDQAAWDLQIPKPGRYMVSLFQGCGTGHGGSEVDIEIAGQTLKWTVEDTGHFQNFVRRDVGEVTFAEPGRYRLQIRPRTKPGAAVMDVREMTLRPIPEGIE